MSAAIIVAYVTFYAAVHSWLASQRVKDWARRAFGPETDCWYRLAFNVVVSVQLIPLLVLVVWLPDRPLYTLPPPWGRLAFLGQVAAFVGIGYGIWLTDAWHFLGLRQLIERTTDRCRRRCPPLVIFGLYRWVRHPLYFLGLMFIWLTPQMTVNRLALFAALSVYLYVGTFFEEGRLVAEFGPAYREYQRQVPRLFPYRGSAHRQATKGAEQGKAESTSASNPRARTGRCGIEPGPSRPVTLQPRPPVPD